MTRSRLATVVVSLAFLCIILTNLRSMYFESLTTATSSARFIPRRKASPEPVSEHVSIVYGFDASVVPRDAGLPEPDVPDAGKRPALSLSDISDGGEDLFRRRIREWGEREDRVADLESP
jgi:hypothetical protein